MALDMLPVYRLEQNYFRTFIGLAIALFLGLSSISKAQTFSAMLDRPSIRLGEIANLTLRIEGAIPAVAPNLPTIPDLSIIGGTATLHESIINGVRSSALIYSYQLSPAKEGDFTFPAISVEVNGKKLSTQPLQLKVLPPGAPLPRAAVPGRPGVVNPAPRSPAPVRAFAKILLPKKEFFLGEVFLADVQVHLLDVQLAAMPLLKADGFTIGRGGQSGVHAAQSNNVVYHVYSFQFPVAAAKTGVLRLGPAEIAVLIPTLDFYAGQRSLRTNLLSAQEIVAVLPLPGEKVPESFRGAVGNYALHASASPTNVAVGDPINVKIQIAGRGTLDALLLPEQKQWRDFKFYPPVTKIESNDPFQIEGSKLFDQTVVPQNTEIKALPPFHFSFFDPDAKNYRTLTWPGIPLVVRPSGSIVLPALPVSGEPGREQKPPDILHIKPHLGASNVSPGLLLERPWLLSLHALPFIGWIWALVWQKQREHRNRNPRLQRERQVQKLVRMGLAELRKDAAAANSDAFFARLFRLLQEQIAERLNLPAASITEAVLDSPALSALSAEAKKELRDLFHICNQFRYGRQPSPSEMRELAERTGVALQEIKKIGLCT